MEIIDKAMKNFINALFNEALEGNKIAYESGDMEFAKPYAEGLILKLIDYTRYDICSLKKLSLDQLKAFIDLTEKYLAELELIKGFNTAN